jgi:hypothetical protein
VVYRGETMRLIRMRVTNFSSFKDTCWIEFFPGINLIVGQNNAGKTAFMHVFDQILEDNRHRNTAEYRQERLAAPSIEFDLDVSGHEVEDGLLMWMMTALPPRSFWWPVETNIIDDEWKKISAFLSESSHIMKLCRQPNSPFTGRDNNPIHGQFTGPIEYYMQLLVENGQIRPLNLAGAGSSGTSDSLIHAMAHLWLANVFSFSAQRHSFGRSGFGREDRLKSDASNLAGILSNLQGEQGNLFDRLVGHLREVFSTVQNLSVAPISQGFEIRVWPTEERLQPELSFGLDNCGTGVAQVIAILTVVMTFERAVIVIDEISSFLHPAAVKALLRIIQTNYAQHQYIIATHSPEVLSAGNPVTVHFVRRNIYDSVVDRVDLVELDQLRDVANHLGVSMTDVFAAERIIWVEGRTEELCLPFIYKETVGQLPRGLIISSVVATGDFEARVKRRDLVFQVYQRLSQAASPLVKSVTFSFDRETLTEHVMHDLNRDARGRLMFLPRRHFECFLLDPAAIAALINTYVPDLADPVSPNDVLAYLESVGGNPEFKTSKHWNGDIFDEKWLAEVDAAALLRAACNQLTENRLAFTKTRQSLELLQHILNHNRTILDGLVAYVTKLFELAQGDAD